MTRLEIEEALKRLRNLKTGADDGLVAEMLKTGHTGLVEAIAMFFTDVLNGDRVLPETWKMTRLKLLFKKGDPELPKNNRPISVIPVMAKLFSIVLDARIQGLVEERLAAEQFGFRKGRGCTDAVHTLQLLMEKSAEWGEPLFMAASDVEKAFGLVHHADLFAAALRCGIGARLVATLKSFYADLHAKVFLWDGAESRSFGVQRGVRQGDPLSTLLFNLVLNEVLEEVRTTWDRRGYGAEAGSTLGKVRLTHVAFADDCTLVARSWLSLQRMILHLRHALQQRGLSLHPSKCQVQTNVAEWDLRGEIALTADFSIDFLPEEEPLTVLGTALSLRDVTACEVQHRIKTGWRLFWSLKALLLKRNSSLKRRLRLLDSFVGSCVLWCAKSWTLRTEEIRFLKTVHRAMLRRIIFAGRGQDEDYINFIRRTTRRAETYAKTSGVRDWIEASSRS